MAKQYKRLISQFLGVEFGERYDILRKRIKVEHWKEKNSNAVSRWRQRKKMKLIEMKGGKCLRCGYDKKVPGAFCFHHRDPKEKEFGLASHGCTRSFEKMVKEVEKCDLLCIRCHAEYHDEEFEKTRNRQYIYTSDPANVAELKSIIQRLEEAIAIRKKEEKTRAEAEVLTQKTIPQHGILGATRISRRKVARPSKEELESQVKQGVSWLELGRKYGVSDMAVKKWAICYGIEIPKRRSDRIDERPCLKCGAVYKPTYEEQQFCSDGCARLARKVERPSKDQMAEMLKTMTYAKVGEKYGVKREAVRRWALAYGLAHLRHPPQG